MKTSIPETAKEVSEYATENMYSLMRGFANNHKAAYSEYCFEMWKIEPTMRSPYTMIIKEHYNVVR